MKQSMPARMLHGSDMKTETVSVLEQNSSVDGYAKTCHKLKQTHGNKHLQLMLARIIHTAQTP